VRMEGVARAAPAAGARGAGGVAIALDDTDDDGSRAADELGFDLGRRPGGAMASTVDEI